MAVGEAGVPRISRARMIGAGIVVALVVVIVWAVIEYRQRPPPPPHRIGERVESPLMRAKMADETLEPQLVNSEGKRTIVCIEDSLSNVRLIECVLLRRPSIDLVVARDAAHGLAVAKKNFPDLILLD